MYLGHMQCYGCLAWRYAEFFKDDIRGTEWHCSSGYLEDGEDFNTYTSTSRVHLSVVN